MIGIDALKEVQDARKEKAALDTEPVSDDGAVVVSRGACFKFSMHLRQSKLCRV